MKKQTNGFQEDAKKEIKEILVKHGADICGVASIGRFDDAPEGFHPKDIYSECKSVIVFGVALPKGLTKVSPSLIYEHFNYIGPVELDRIGFFSSGEIERTYQNAIAVPIPADNPYEYWDANNMIGKGLLSMKHAAVKAGIGQMGKSTLLLNSKFGNLLSIGAILTNLELPSDPYAEDICIKSCRLCLDRCPVKAPDGVSVNQKSCRTYAYGSNEKGYDVVICNKCRTICPIRYGKQDGNKE